MSKISDSGIAEQQRAHATREVKITLRLPHDVATQAEQLQEVEPEFLERVVFYGVTRRRIYRELKERAAGTTNEPRRIQ